MEIALVLLILAGTGWLFVTEKYPAPLVALMGVAGLMVVALLVPWLPWVRAERWITLGEGVSGFSNQATVTVAAMFVLSAGLQNTGAIAALGPALARLARRPVLFLLALMALVSAVSAFVNNTAAVAVFLPIVLTACARSGLPASRLLIPLSYAAQFGGVCTLIGTSTNLLVSAAAERAGLAAFRMFELAPVGLALTGAGIVYLLLVHRWLLPERPGAGGGESYQILDYVAELQVPADSPLAGRAAGEVRLSRLAEVRLLGVRRGGQPLAPGPGLVFAAHDTLLLRTPPAELHALRREWRLAGAPEAHFGDLAKRDQELGLAEVIVAPRSRLAGQPLDTAGFARRHGCAVLGVHRGEEAPAAPLDGAHVAAGDALLLLGPRPELARLRTDPELLLLDRVHEPALRRAKIPLALGIFATVVLLATTGVVPILVAALCGCIGLVVTRCLTLDEACEAIDWKVIFLLAGALPLGLAMEKSGAAMLIAEAAVGVARPFGPWAALAMLYLVVAVLTEFMSNTATAVLMAPIAIAVAASLGVDARPLLMAVCFAASTSFCTPVGYQTNAMVQHAGGYRFADYIRIGLPLNVVFWALCVWLIPRFWPF